MEQNADPELILSDDDGELSGVELDVERQKLAKEYARINRRMMLIGLGLGAVYIVIWLVTGWHKALGAWIDGQITMPWLAVAVYVLLFGLPYTVLDLPLSYYTDFVLPHRYGQSNQTLGGWILDQVKGLTLSAVLGFVVLEVIYLLLRVAPNLWWLYAALFILFFTVALSSLAPVLIAPLFYKFTPLEDEELARRLVSLAEHSGTKVGGVFRFDMSTRTKSANAALMGLGATRRIVLGDTLLDEFTADEIETVLAHELGHHVHRDIPLGIVINSVLTLLSLYIAHLIMSWSTGFFNLANIADLAGLPIFLATMGIIGLLAMPLGNAYSRWRERMADRYALETTQNPGAFADAMMRLANQNLADTEPELWVVWLLYSHPPIQERVDNARHFAVSHQL